MKPFTIIAAMVCGIYLLLEWTEGKTCYYTTTIDENGAAKWIRDKGDCDVIKFGGVKTTATPKSFTGKGISTTTEDILTSSTAQTSEDIPSAKAVGRTNNPPGKGISTTTEDILTSSTAHTSEDTPSTEAVGSTNNLPDKGISTTTEDILTSSTAHTSEDTPSTEAVGSTNNPPGKGISTTTEDILTSSTAHTSEDTPSTEAVGSTNNPPDKGISTTTEDILTSSTAHTSEDTPSTEAVGSTNNPPGKGISTTTEDILTSSTAHTSEDTPSTEAVGSTNNPPGKGISTTTEDTLTSSTAHTSEDTPSTEAVGSTNNPPGKGSLTTTEDILTSSTAHTSEDIPPKEAVGSTYNPPGKGISTTTEDILTSSTAHTSEDTPSTEAVGSTNNPPVISTTTEDIPTSSAAQTSEDIPSKEAVGSTNNPSKAVGSPTVESLFTDCQEVYDAGHTQDGVYTIKPTGWPGSPFNVSCNMENGGGWTVFQRRTDGSTSFYQNWTAYKEGFGDSRNLWLGNEKLHYLTNQRNYKLRFDITTSNGSALYAEFTEFQIKSESSNYTMNKLGTRSGNTGEYFSKNKGKQFSTHDRDNDGCGNFDCAEKHRSGWWYSNTLCTRCFSTSHSYCNRFQYSSSCMSFCTAHNLNGVYNGGNGEMIYSRYNNCNVQFVEMKIRPSS
ncbi:uncharacterized protein [Apostichopus japonicus]|uniref:uncharacterized protein n=1 Tax=Stichopus japonicus TaxID=307972 RepID=UPI003AB72B3D